ncbi:OLC1v1012076C2 [Oldenlandia corymbosa var. corymbosa]|uniref:OLC1v1012076C2 n=1 Tax=Oldenlandia corymbosa var. corymbosa TaxID=529605 RepID=A0AAV1DYB1_OLDCO|nr:OLC1v1012076C2 [Oldenlandia corymbosa var. corymbosa]
MTMTAPSISVIRLKATPLPSPFPPLSSTHRRGVRCFFTIPVASSVRRQPQRQKQYESRKAKQSDKRLLKVRESVKQLAEAPAPALSPDDMSPRLSETQAIGLVAASQANFMRVIVQILPPEQEEEEEHSGNVESAADEGNTKSDSVVRGWIGMELLCVVKAVLKKIKRRVLVGDRVLVGSIDWVDRRGMIEDVFERDSETGDPPVANVDHLVVMFSMDKPKPEASGLNRFLVEAESTGIPFTIAFNKCELVDQQTLLTWKSRLQSWGYEPVFCSVESNHGLDVLHANLRGKTSVIIGPSGVGKSSLINALRNNKEFVGTAEQDNWFDPILGSNWLDEQRVAEVSTRSGRGKHTTRHVSLLPLLGGGYLADTPGYNQPNLMKVTKDSLAQHFPEIRKMLKEKEPSKCSFNDCSHLGEQGCVVSGDWERYAYYLELFDEIKLREEFQLRTLGTKREGDVRYVYFWNCNFINVSVSLFCMYFMFCGIDVVDNRSKQEGTQTVF